LPFYDYIADLDQCSMRQTDSAAEKRGTRRKWLFLCLAALLLLCVLPGVILRILRLRPMVGGDDIEPKNRNDIARLHEAVVNFQTKYGVDYIPSRIRLLDSGKYDLSMNNDGQPTNQLDRDSYLYLQRLWPRLQFPVDWNNNEKKDDDVTLEGDQCLVFFLGGIQSSNEGKLECLGFSTHGLNPAQEGRDRVAPIYDFKPSRLSAQSNGYFVYLDAYGKAPYAYFSSYKTRNGYNRYGQSDCSSIPDGPYHDGNGNYYNPETFQIISAGADGKFGRGGNGRRRMPRTSTPTGAMI
jgi:hypothetical protein